MVRAASLLLGVAALCAACAASPPPVAVPTPYGVVRADTEAKAEEVAALLRDLAPRVREILPGTHEDRAVDVWVQAVLRDGRHGQRAEGVKGFTLLSGEFQARRIHLLEDGELSWYLAHELVHASLDPSWRTLPGVLEEGLGDVVAEILNEEHADRIRAHRLFTSSGFFDGVLFRLAYRAPEPRGGDGWLEIPLRIEVLGEEVDATPIELLSLSRRELRRKYREVPEAFYGLAYLVVSRVVERVGLDGLHAMCAEADAEGLEIVPAERLLAAAELDAGAFGPETLASFFGRSETRQLLLMQPEIFAETVAAHLAVHLGDVSTRTMLFHCNPCLRTADGEDVRLRSLWPVRRALVARWRDRTLAGR